MLTPRRTAGLLLIVTALLYAPTLGYGFVYEDLNDPQRFLAPNPSLSGALQDALYYPPRALTGLSYGLSRAIGSPVEPWGYHAVNVALHLVNSAVVYLIASAVLSPWGAVGALGVFALHPLQVEAVAYISSRPDLMVTLCILLAILAVESKRWGLAGIACALALVSKETGVAAVPLVGLWMAWRGAKRPSVRVTVLAGSLGLGMVALLASRYTLGIDLTYTGRELIKAYAFLLRMPVPIGFSIDHDWMISPSMAAFGLALTAFVALLACLRPRSVFALASAWVVLCLAPRFALPLVEGLHEHHMYAPLVGVALLVGHLVTSGVTDGIPAAPSPA